MNPIPYLLHKKKKIIFRSMGTSMIPVLFPGDKICIAKVNIQTLNENDIVAVYKNGSLIIHRLIYIHRSNNIVDWVVTKGDNNYKSDGMIRTSEIIGVMRYRVVRGKISYPDNIYLIQSTLYLKELRNLCQVFNEQKLKYVILKGLPLHLFYEKKIPKKLYADCDILISPSEYDLCVNQLSRLGFKLIDNTYIKHDKNSKLSARETSFYKNVNNFPIVLDIHIEPVFSLTQLSSTEFFYSARLMEALSKAMIEDVRYIKVQESEFPILTEKYLIPYLLTHLFHHNFQGIHRLKFISEILSSINKTRNKYEIFSEILKTIYDYKLNNYVWGGLYLLNKYFYSKENSYLLSKIRISKFINLISLYIIKRLSVFDDPSSRTIDGVIRFISVFIFSSNNIFTRICIFFYPKTWLMIYQAGKNIVKLKKV